MIEMIGAGVLAPAVIAFGVCWLLGRLLPDPAGSRFSIVVGLLAGFVIGYVLLPDWAALKPSRHWHWLPWIGLLAGLTGMLGVRAGLMVRGLLSLATSAVAAWFLVPTWTSLDPPRVVWLVALSVGLCMLIGMADPLPARFGGQRVLGLLCVTAVAVAAMIAACVSVTYAQLAGLAVCALAGVWGASSLRQGVDPQAVRAALPAGLILVAGIAFVGCIESERPQYGFMLLPAALLGLWACELPFLRRLSGRKATIASVAVVVLPLLAAAAATYARLF